jgi:hypothetical protein
VVSLCCRNERSFRDSSLRRWTVNLAWLDRGWLGPRQEKGPIMGGVVKSIGDSVGAVAGPVGNMAISGIAPTPGGAAGANSVASLQAQVAHLTKLVHILWKEVHLVEQYLHIDSTGMHIKVGGTNLKILHTGLVLDAPQIQHKTLGQVHNLP